ncbi:MAG: hypothetical protein ACLRVU_01015 [Beduini sp.]|uniref:hypothetical protein n=1 Tax=Beduini sp. TaxID=1922300 RepID=UPI0039A1DAFB
MAREYLTDEEVEYEIERLTNSREVKLARLEQRLKYLRRQRLYTLRHLEKRGKKLIEEGITADLLRTQSKCLEEEL